MRALVYLFPVVILAVSTAYYWVRKHMARAALVARLVSIFEETASRVIEAAHQKNVEGFRHYCSELTLVLEAIAAQNAHSVLELVRLRGKFSENDWAILAFGLDKFSTSPLDFEITDTLRKGATA